MPSRNRFLQNPWHQPYSLKLPTSWTMHVDAIWQIQ